MMKVICGWELSQIRIRTFLLTGVLMSGAVLPIGERGNAAASTLLIEPKAISALQGMSTFLRSLKTFDVSATSSTDQQIDNGQIVQFSHRSDLLVKIPDKLRLEITDGLSSRSVIYNGKAFTLYDGRSNYYTTQPAPPTIDQFVTQLEESYGTQLPLADLFKWKGSPDQLAALQSGIYIGSENVAGEICEHYAFRQADIDWQIWVRAGTEPYPCQTVIIRRDDSERPRHTINYAWQKTLTDDPSRFDFAIPPGARPVPIRDMRNAHSHTSEVRSNEQ
jgi:hypothetical protein